MPLTNGAAFISSAYRGQHVFQEREHARIAAALCLLALKQGYSPYASHLLCTQFLDDNRPDHREFGIAAGHKIMSFCNIVLVYQEHAAFSSGVKFDLQLASQLGIPVKFITPADLQESLAEILPSRLYNRVLGQQ